MSRISPALGRFFEKMEREMTVQEGEKMTTNKAEAVLQENQRSEVTVRGFKFIQDEPATVMGTAKGPTPTDFFIASVALCENVIFARNAAMENLPVDSLKTEASGTWNMKGIFEIEGSDPSFRSITVVTLVETKGDPSTVVKVAQMTHRRCPIYATLRKSVQLEFELVVNGSPVQL